MTLAVAGLGTVGAGTVKLLHENRALIAARAGADVAVGAVSARDASKNRGVDLSNFQWFDDPVEMATQADADIFVELIGGSGGAAKAAVLAALGAGKHVVTANKALIAHHGAALAERAEAAGLVLAYEAAVAGGIPIIKVMREGLAANRFDRVYGILNGTCNYILTAMRETGGEFADILAEAQALGYAEADPSFDIDGVDAAHKLAILAALAFGSAVRFEDLHIEGIRDISALDIKSVDELGYRIKLLGIANRQEGRAELRVHPCLVDKSAPIAAVEGVTNAVVAEGNFVGSVICEGPGAGAGPTASAVVSDVIDIARGIKLPTFATPVSSMPVLETSPMDGHRGCHYIRLTVHDQPGVIADVAAALRDEGISVESMLQRGRGTEADGAVPVILTTHETTEAALNRALSRISAMSTTLGPPCVLRIESL